MATFITVKQDGSVRKVKITTRKWVQGSGFPALYDVLIDGENVGPQTDYSKARVLTMGRRFLPVLDGGSNLANFGSTSTRSDCAMDVAMSAIREGYVPHMELDEDYLAEYLSQPL